MLPARDYSLGPARSKIIFWCFIPYNNSFIDQASSVKMSGYWPRSFFAWLWTWAITSNCSCNFQELAKYEMQSFSCDFLYTAHICAKAKAKAHQVESLSSLIIIPWVNPFPRIQVSYFSGRWDSFLLINFYRSWITITDFLFEEGLISRPSMRDRGSIPLVSSLRKTLINENMPVSVDCACDCVASEDQA